MAHAVQLSDREVGRLAETRTRIAHCPSSNLFLASGVMPLARYLEAGVVIGLGSDVAAGPELSLFSVMRAGAYTQSGLRTMLGEQSAVADAARLADAWARLEGARALGLDGQHRVDRGRQGSRLHLCRPGRHRADPRAEDSDDPADIMSRLIYRGRPDMVRRRLGARPVAGRLAIS